MTTVRNTGHTVEFSGVEGLTLVADEWSVIAAADAATAADDPHAARRRPESVLLEEHRPGLSRRRIPRGRPGQPRPWRQRSGTRRRLRVEALSGDALQVLAAIGRPVVLIGASMGGRPESWRPGPGRYASPSWCSSTHPTSRRTAATVSAISCSAGSTGSARSTRPPTQSPPTFRTGPGRAARRG